MSRFYPKVWVPWVMGYLGSVFQSRYDFQRAPAGNGSMYRLGTSGDTLQMAIAGDWGSGTVESESVIAAMVAGSRGVAPDLTVHLGDVYYVGGDSEFAENCLGRPTKDSPPIDGVLWQAGTKGTFALCGNHEMYATGKPYYTDFLSCLRMPDGTVGQGCSFFCIENSNWRILGLDTGYNSVKSPLISWLPGQSADCAFPDPLVEWLRNTVNPRSNPKATIILTHHQYYSGFETQYPLPAQQLEEFFDSPVIWLWGHEHRLAGYNLFGPGNLQAYGRCVGNGGMPIDAIGPTVPSGVGKFFQGDPDGPARSNLLFYDKRANPLYPGGNDGTPVGLNGFARLSLNGPSATIDYLSLDPDLSTLGQTQPGYQCQPTLLYTETFTCTGPMINPPTGRVVSTDPDFVVFGGANANQQLNMGPSIAAHSAIRVPDQSPPK